MEDDFLTVYKKTDSPKWIADPNQPGKSYNENMLKIDTKIKNLETKIEERKTIPNIITPNISSMMNEVITNNELEGGITANKLKEGLSGDKIKSDFNTPASNYVDGTTIFLPIGDSKLTKNQVDTSGVSGACFKAGTLPISRLKVSGTQITNGTVSFKRVPKKLIIAQTGIGMINYISIGVEVPTGYLLCDGSLIPNNPQYDILKRIIGESLPNSCPWCPEGHKTIVKAY